MINIHDMYNYPSKEQLEAIPEKKRKRILATFEESDSYAYRYLKFHIKNKDFKQLLRDAFGLPDESEVDNTVYNTLYAVTRQEKSRVSYSIIFRCRHFIPPLYWYYNYKEDLPAPIKYTPKYKVITEEMCGTPTVGHRALFALIDEYGINHLCDRLKIDLPLHIVKNLIYKRKRLSGAISFKSIPSYDSILALKDYIQPDKWYIFPDELEQQ